MREITKAQVTIGLLAFFATMWELVQHLGATNLWILFGVLLLQLVVLLIWRIS